MSFLLGIFSYSYHVIQVAVSTPILRGFVSEAAVLVIMARCDTHTTSLLFVAYLSCVIIFIVVKVLHDSVLFIE